MPLFYTKRDGYAICKESFIEIEDLANNTKNIIFGSELDTEFGRKHPLNDPTARLQPMIVITNQLRAIDEDEGVIFAHQDIKSFARHPIFKSGFSVIDYLMLLGERDGFKVENFTRHTGEIAKSLHRTCNSKGEKIEALPVLEIACYAFYAVAELGKIATDAYKSDLVALARANAKQPRIEQKRRLRTVSKPGKKGFTRDYVNMPWSVDIEGVTYRIRLFIMDTSAIHGIASYASFCEATGVELKYKELFKNEKGEMVRMYQERPEDFDNYALGDLYNYPALMSNVTLFKQVYESLGLSEYFQKPKPTIGATVRDLFEGRIAKEFGFSSKRKEINLLIEKICLPANANHLKLQTDSTLCLNAKVRGGRCRNNKPIYVSVNGFLVDIDISGCYGEGQRNQLMLFGNPVKIHYPMNLAGNNYITLGEFLKKWRHELIYGCWQAIVSSSENLKHSQDFVNSWIEPKQFREIANLETDTDDVDEEELDDWLDKEIGSTKIYNHQIINGLITHDFLEWLEKVCGEKQRKELLEKLVIRTALIHPKSERVNFPNELLESIDNWQEGNSVDIKIEKGKSETITNSRECHAWYGVNMGDFLITRLLQLRKEAKKIDKKSPLQTLYKLCINTLYGDLVSPYFAISHVVVGNNITARARALAWYMEKGFNGWQSITDGCVFDINKVIFPVGNRSLNGENTVNLYRETNIAKLRKLNQKPLTNNGEITIERWEKVYDKDGKIVIEDDKECIMPVIKISDEIIENSHDWIAQKAWEHLQNVFPNVSILHAETTDIAGNPRKGMFVFEVKECYLAGAFHGTANYLLVRGDGQTKTKMRSYESKKQHERYGLIDNELARLSDLEKVPPSEVFLKNLLENPNKVIRSKTFMKEGILKCAEYCERYQSKYGKTRLSPGDTIFKIGLLKEFSLSQFTFQTREQCESWEKEMQSLKRKYGQSYEMFFLNKDGSLRYQEMIDTIDRLISENKMGFSFKRNEPKEHPELKPNELLKEELEKAYQIEDIGEEQWESYIVEEGYESYDVEVIPELMEAITFDGNLDDFEFDL